MLKNIILIILISTGLFAQIPEGYYDGTENLYGDALKSVLNNIIDNHNELSYADLWDALPDTDQDPNNSDNVIQLYTGWSVSNSGYPIWNREHVWAKSHGDFGNTAPCGTDLHHIRPSHLDVNSARGNKDFDNGGTQHSIATGCYYDGDSWEPRDEVKGDVARLIFYMATRYEGEDGELDLIVVDEVNTSPAPEHGKLSTLLEWNIQDPPDEFEQNRNDRIYYNWQNNRNPYVDHPEFADYIWGEVILTADFSADQTFGNPPLTVNFTDNSVSSTAIVSWSWDFDGDGNEDSTIQNPSFIYQEIGLYNVSLTIVDNEGDSDTETKIDFIEINNTIFPVEILSSSFEAIPTGWLVESIASDLDWERSNDNSNSTHPSSTPDGEWYMYANNYNGNEPADDWLISPTIDLSEYDDPYCNFQSWTKYSDAVNGLEFKITNNFTGNPSSTNWNTLNANLPDQNSAVWWNSEDIDLSDYTNDNNIRIAFHYTSTGGGSGDTTAWAIDDVTVMGTEQSIAGNNVVANTFNLHNYPNPFNPSTTIYFSVKQTFSFVTLEIYNIKGQKVDQLKISNEELKIGEIIWDAEKFPSGIYFYKLIIDNKTAASQRCILIK